MFLNFILPLIDDAYWLRVKLANTVRGRENDFITLRSLSRVYRFLYARLNVTER